MALTVRLFSTLRDWAVICLAQGERALGLKHALTQPWAS